MADAKPTPITIGSPAPTLSVKTWLKGTPVTELAKDKTYVVEFWATWCGPCISSIPHVTELAKKNPDVTFLGIGIWEDEGPQLKAFVEKMGDKMGYNVGYSGTKDGMAVSWMDAAAQNGIPSAFIVKDGAIQWIGHPMSMDAPLAEIKAGTWDVVKFKAEFDKEAEATREEMATRAELTAISKQYSDGKRAEAKTALAAFVVAHPTMKNSADAMAFGWLAAEDPKAWEVRAKELAASKESGDTQTLMQFAVRRVAKPEGFAQGKRAVEIALAAKPEDFIVLQYARYVFKRTGDTKLALDAVNALLKGYATGPAKDDAEFKAGLEKEKADLEAALAKKGS